MTVSTAQSLETKDSFEHLCGPGCAGHRDPTAGITAADEVDLSLLMGEVSEPSSPRVESRSGSFEVLHECGSGCSHGQASPMAGIAIAASFDLGSFNEALPAAAGRYPPQDAARTFPPEAISPPTSVRETTWSQIKGDPVAAATATKPVEAARFVTHPQADAVSRIESAIQPTRTFYSAPQTVEQRAAYSGGMTSGYQAPVQEVATRFKVPSPASTPTQNTGYRRADGEGVATSPRTVRVDLNRLPGSMALNSSSRSGGEPSVMRRMPMVVAEGAQVVGVRPPPPQSGGPQVATPRAAPSGVAAAQAQAELRSRANMDVRRVNTPETAPHMEQRGGFKGWASERARPEAQRSSPGADSLVRREQVERQSVGNQQVATGAALRRQNKLAHRLEDQRQIVFERLARIVSKAQTGAKGAGADEARFRYLDLATKMLELLLDEERDEDGLSSLGIRGVRRFRYPIAGRRSRLRSRPARAISDSDRKKERQKQRERRGEVARKGIEKMVASASKLGVSTKSAPTKVISATNSGPSKSLDIFQAKCDDDNGSDDGLMEGGSSR